jgi:hypothetical protein
MIVHVHKSFVSILTVNTSWYGGPNATMGCGVGLTSYSLTVTRDTSLGQLPNGNGTTGTSRSTYPTPRNPSNLWISLDMPCHNGHHDNHDNHMKQAFRRGPKWHLQPGVLL